MGIRFFKGFVYTVLYMLFAGLLGASLGESGSDEGAIAVVVISLVGFVPFFTWMSGKIFYWPAKKSTAVSEQEMTKTLETLKVEGFPFELTKVADHYVLTPDHVSESFTNFISRHNIKQVYYMKVWVEANKNTIRFKDYLVSATSTLTPSSISKAFSSKSGVVTTSITMLGDSGKLIRFSNARLHEALIEAVTQKGWNVKAKII